MQASLGSTGGHYLRAIRRHWILVLVVPLVALAVGVGWAKVRSRHYQFTARILVSPIPGGDPTLADLPVLHDSADPATTIQTAAALVDSETAATLAASRLGPKWSASRVRSAVTVQPEGGSNLIDVTASAAGPGTAALVANTFGQASLDARNAALQQQIDAALKALNRQLAASVPGGANALSLSARISSLQGERGVPDPTLSLVQPAAAATIAGASASKVAALALVAGLLLGCAGAILMDASDGTLRDEDDVAAAYPLPVPILGRIPRVSGPRRLGSAELAPAESEAYRFLAKTLELATWSERARVVAVTSASRQEGKTTVVSRLGVALAETGSKTLLVSADLHWPALHEEFGIPVGAGLIDMIGNVNGRRAAARPRSITRVGPRLYMLTSGRPPADPTAVLTKDAVQALFDRVRQLNWDYVLLDLPPLLAVAETQLFVRQADSTLLVSFAGRSTTDQLAQARELLDRLGVRPAGVVLLGVRGDDSPAYARRFRAVLRAGEGA